MTASDARLGTDLRLLANLQQDNDRMGGSDLLTTTAPTQDGRPGLTDLQTVQGAQNMQQALMVRFLTRPGALTALGHPDYGSRLYTLIGQLNTPANRNSAKLFVLEALAAEPRVASVVSVDVTAGARDRIDISVSLLTITSDTPLNLVFPFYLAGAQR
jgi:phage baseplate assembly protein W